MLQGKREGEATVRRILRPSCLLRTADSKLRGDKPVTGHSTGGKRETRIGWADTLESQGELGLEQDSQAKMVDPRPKITGGEKCTVCHQLQVSARQAREMAATWWTRDITAKTRRARAQYRTPTQRGAPLPSYQESMVNSPRYIWEEMDQSLTVHMFLREPEQ